MLLALVFAAIAVFQTGTRYGSDNFKAIAISDQLKLLTQIRVPVHHKDFGRRQLPIVSIMLIDKSIVAGVKHRQLWYLNKKAKTELNQTLAAVLAMRGPENVIQHLENAKGEDDASNMKIKALRKAEIELADLIEKAKLKPKATPGEGEEATDAPGEAESVEAAP